MKMDEVMGWIKWRVKLRGNKKEPKGLRRKKTGEERRKRMRESAQGCSEDPKVEVNQTDLPLTVEKEFHITLSLDLLRLWKSFTKREVGRRIGKKRTRLRVKRDRNHTI